MKEKSINNIRDIITKLSKAMGKLLINVHLHFSWQYHYFKEIMDRYHFNVNNAHNRHNSLTIFQFYY